MDQFEQRQLWKREQRQRRVIFMRFAQTSLLASTPLPGDQNVPFLLVRTQHLRHAGLGPAFRTERRFTVPRVTPLLFLQVPLLPNNPGPKWCVYWGVLACYLAKGFMRTGSKPAPWILVGAPCSGRGRLLHGEVFQTGPGFPAVWCLNLVCLGQSRTLWLGAWALWGEPQEIRMHRKDGAGPPPVTDQLGGGG